MAKPPAGRPVGVPNPIKRKGSRFYYIRMKVPQASREALGKTELWQSLETDDLAVAWGRAVVEAGWMRAQIEAARRNPDGTRRDVKGDPTVEQRKTEAWWVERRVPDPRRPGRYLIPEELETEWSVTVDEVLGDPINRETSGHLGLHPKDLADLDLKRILSGLSSIADGVAALRTHRGSAHGHAHAPDVQTYRLAPRHARLAVHAAHTMALFVLETWEARGKVQKG